MKPATVKTNPVKKILSNIAPTANKASEKLSVAGGAIGTITMLNQTIAKKVILPRPSPTDGHSKR